MKEEKETKVSKGSTAGKVKRLQKQYNKILVDLFDQFAAESIEEALEKNEGSFGENIGEIVQCALDCLKTKVMDELGIKDGNVAVGIAIDGMGIDLGDTGSASDGGAGDGEDHPGMPELFKSTEESDSEEESEEDEEDEKVEESTEADEGVDDEDDKTEFLKHANRFKKQEKQKGKIKKHIKPNKQNEPKEESIKVDKFLSKSRRDDQVSLTEAYLGIYKNKCM